VRNGDRREGSLLHDIVERRLHDLLARVVERAGRLVEQHDARLLDDGPRDGDALLLPARELAAAQAHLRVVALVESLQDEVVRVGELGCLLDIGLRGTGQTHLNVLGHGADEERRLL